MKNYLMILMLITMVSCKQEPPLKLTATNGYELKQKKITQVAPTGNPLTQSDLDQFVKSTIATRNDFRWEWVDLTTLWSALQYNNHQLAIGYQPTGFTNLQENLHLIDLQQGEWKAVHDALLNLIVSKAQELDPTVSLAALVVEDDAVLPIITIATTDAQLLTTLANLENVRYLEPIDYYPLNQAPESSSGCSSSSTTVQAADVSTITPGCLQPWNYANMNIPSAWNTSSGTGITVGVIDAGISNTQTILGTDFNNGMSSVGRTFTAGYTYGTSAYSSCTHGTSMSGLVAASRNNLGAPLGAAYQSNIYFVRACEDVVLDGSAERTGVKNALTLLGNNADVKIISMSIGTPFSSNVLYDGITYANNRGKLILAAAGTSFSWTAWWGVIYPAAWSECVAVTGVKENGSKCSSCHDGSQVDFTVVMERNASSSRNSVSLKPSGTGGAYIGGSSAATATAAGIAALVWSVKPTLTKSQVISIMEQTAQFYPTRSSSKGYGNLNAGNAVNLALTY
jgi:serine protease